MLQQDNPTTHIAQQKLSILPASHHQANLNKILCQQPNPPHFNLLDIDFFNAIESLRIKKGLYQFPISLNM